MYVYKTTEPGLFTTGFYDPAGKWHPEGDYNSGGQAADRVHWLNGGDDKAATNALLTQSADKIDELRRERERLISALRRSQDALEFFVKGGFTGACQDAWEENKELLK